MDELAIQELCRQLGIGVDKASELISTYLPQVAGLKIAAAWTWITVCIACAAVFVGLWFRAKDEDEDLRAVARFASIIIWMVLFIFVVCNVYDIVTWSMCPEARLLTLILGGKV